MTSNPNLIYCSVSPNVSIQQPGDLKQKGHQKVWYGFSLSGIVVDQLLWCLKKNFFHQTMPNADYLLSGPLPKSTPVCLVALVVVSGSRVLFIPIGWDGRLVGVFTSQNGMIQHHMYTVESHYSIHTILFNILHNTIINWPHSSPMNMHSCYNTVIRNQKCWNWLAIKASNKIMHKEFLWLTDKIDNPIHRLETLKQIMKISWLWPSCLYNRNPYTGKAVFILDWV